MKNTELVAMLRNPQLRNNTDFIHPSGESEVNFSFEEVEIDAETWTITTSSAVCGDVLATVVITVTT